MSIDDGVHSAPGQAQIGMVALGFGDGAGAVHEIERGFEIGEQERLLDVMSFDHFPVRELGRELLQSFAFERRDAATARDTVLIGKTTHSRFTHTSLSRTWAG